MNIRPMKIEDTSNFEELMAQLGYPASKDELQQRFHQLLQLPLYYTAVAEIEGELAGFVGMCKQWAYEFDKPYVRILALVVHEKYRRQQIGQALMENAIHWARHQGCISITLNSGNREERRAAHEFYESLGFIGKSTGYSKWLE